VIQNYVSDEEKLYRNVRGEGADEFFYDPTTGRLKIESKAFLDQQKEPSVDRAKLKNFDPQKSRIGKEDGVVTIITQEVRQIGDVVTNNNEGKKVNHAVDVNPDPISQNAAHARIVVVPRFFGSQSKKDKAFRLLRIALARLASQRGWTLEPQHS
jgi:hypothetical protein